MNQIGRLTLSYFEFQDVIFSLQMVPQSLYFSDHYSLNVVFIRISLSLFKEITIKRFLAKDIMKNIY